MDQREELARIITRCMTGGHGAKPKLIDYQAADAILAAGWEKSSPAGESAGVEEATGLSWSGTAVTIDFAHPEHARNAFRSLDALLAARASQPSPDEVEEVRPAEDSQP